MEIKLITLKLSDVLPNPHRAKIGSGILHPDKLEAVKASMKENGVWDCWPVRKNKEGLFEMVGSTHRHKAARDLFGSKFELRFQLVDYDDGQMLRGMIDENLAGEESKNLPLRERADYILAVQRFVSEKPDHCQLKKKHEHGDVDCVKNFMGDTWTTQHIATLLVLNNKLAPSLGHNELLKTENAERLSQFPVAVQEALVKQAGGEKSFTEDVGKRAIKAVLDATKEERKAVDTATGQARVKEEERLRKRAMSLLDEAIKQKKTGNHKNSLDTNRKPLPKKMTRDEIVLAFFSLLSFDAIKVAWKQQAALFHPDHGGDAAVAAELNELWTKIKKLYGKD